MELHNTILNYITGEKFSEATKFSIPKEDKILGRMEFVEQLVKGKNVLHIGCLDHLPLIKEKIKKRLWFHQRLTDVASQCVGIDIDQKGIDYVSSVSKSRANP